MQLRLASKSTHHADVSCGCTRFCFAADRADLAANVCLRGVWWFDASHGVGLVMMSPSPGVIVGNRYVLSRPLAKGGMGSVWIARHRELDVDVSVKFMMPTLVESAELRARFEREAKVAARLRSQHVVQVLDFGIDDGMPYIAMELLEGENLADRLKRETSLSLPKAVQILMQVCKALRTAHEAGLVHRDLKPGNIFLARKDGEEVVKVLDFGIVKDTAKNDADDGAGATETGVMMGSVHYMSPEQIRSSRQVDHRSDLWSVAVILYKLLTGNAPFPGTNQGDVMVRVCTDSCPPPSHYTPTLPRTVDSFFVRALTRDPAGRFQSAQEMSDAFAAAAMVGPVAIPATQPPQQWVKTLPLLGNTAQLRASIENASGPGQTARAPQPSTPNDSSFLSSAVRETAAGTFQAVTMPGMPISAATGSAIAIPAAPPKSQKGLIVAVAVAVTVLGLGLVVFLMMGGPSTPDTPVQAASATPPAAPSMMVTPAANTDRIPPASPTTGTSVVAPSTAKTPNTTRPVTTPKTAPAPRKNPLDIND